jgi:ankyrin repeat protein
VAALVAAGADVNAHMESTRPSHRETPLHWAASSNDVAVLDALLDAGADIEADGAVIAGGTAMADATAFANWDAARRLLARGAQTTLWKASALGLMERVEAQLAADPPPSPQDVTGAFWAACHGGQRSTAELLLARGADPQWVGWDDLTAAGAARRNGFGEVADWAGSLGRPGD